MAVRYFDAEAEAGPDLDLFSDAEDLPLALDEVLRVDGKMGFGGLETLAGEDDWLEVKDLLFVLAVLLTRGECSFL